MFCTKGERWASWTIWMLSKPWPNKGPHHQQHTMIILYPWKPVIGFTDNIRVHYMQYFLVFFLFLFIKIPLYFTKLLPIHIMYNHTSSRHSEMDLESSRMVAHSIRFVVRAQSIKGFLVLTKYPSYVHEPNFIIHVCSSNGKYSTSISQKDL